MARKGLPDLPSPGFWGIPGLNLGFSFLSAMLGSSVVSPGQSPIITDPGGELFKNFSIS
jgi:hypothetical protein